MVKARRPTRSAAIRPHEDDLEDIFLRYYQADPSELAGLHATLRLRLVGAPSPAAVGLVAVMAAVGALFPAVGHTIGYLHVPKSVAHLLGGADYATMTGWFRSEIGRSMVRS